MEAVLNGPDGQNPLGPTALTIGRRAENRLVVNDVRASSHHAEIRPEGQGYTIIDLGSTNGTFVNDQRLNPNVPHMLNAGDRIRIGDTTYTYYVTDPSAADPTIYAPSDQPGYQPTVAVSPPDYGQNVQPQQNVYSPPPPIYQGQQQPQQPPNYQPYPAPPQPMVPPPGYPRQPMQPPPGQKPRSRKGLWIALGIIGGVLVLCIVASVAVLAIVAANASTPTKTLNTFCSDLKSGNYHDAYQQFSPSFQNRSGNSEQQFTTGLQGLFASGGGLKDCTISNVNSTDPNGTGVMTWTVNRSPTPAIIDMVLIDDSGAWKISDLKPRSS